MLGSFVGFEESVLMKAAAWLDIGAAHKVHQAMTRKSLQVINWQ